VELGSWSLLVMGFLAHGSSERPTFMARLEGGPRRGSVLVVKGRDTGYPPDLIRIPGLPTGIYVLAGLARRDGGLPYWWMSRTRLAQLRARGDRRRGGRILNIP
jgi:hypothetical protein